jgi:hypothetical protein
LNPDAGTGPSHFQSIVIQLKISECDRKYDTHQAMDDLEFFDPFDQPIVIFLQQICNLLIGDQSTLLQYLYALVAGLESIQDVMEEVIHRRLAHHAGFHVDSKGFNFGC